MNKPAIAIALVAGFLAVVVIAGGVVAIGYFAANGIAAVPTDAQKRLVLSSKDFEQYEIELDPKCGKLEARRNLDRTFDVEYTHDCGDEDVVLISSIAEINPTLRDARQSFVINIGVYKTGVKIGSGELHPRDELLTLGDEHFAGVIHSTAGTPSGNVFLVRQGRVVHTLLVTGLYFDENGDGDRLLAPLIEESRRQYPAR
jgi:hypothetical protein